MYNHFLWRYTIVVGIKKSDPLTSFFLLFYISAVGIVKYWDFIVFCLVRDWMRVTIDLLTGNASDEEGTKRRGNNNSSRRMFPPSFPSSCFLTLRPGFPSVLVPLVLLFGLLLDQSASLSDSAFKLNAKCKDLFSCTVKKKCVQVIRIAFLFTHS